MLKRTKIAIAFGASAVGLMLPWRARVAYSEILGWVAQQVPPSFTSVDLDDQDREGP